MYWVISPGQDWNTARLSEASTWQHLQSQCHLPHSLQIHTKHPSFQPVMTVKAQVAMSPLHPCRKEWAQSLHTYSQHRQERLSYLSNCEHRGKGRAGRKVICLEGTLHLPTVSEENTPHCKTIVTDTLGRMFFHTTTQLKPMLCALKKRSKKNSGGARKTPTSSVRCSFTIYITWPRHVLTVKSCSCESAKTVVTQDTRKGERSEDAQNCDTLSP